MLKYLGTVLICIMILAAPNAAAVELSHPNRGEVKKLDPASCGDGFSFVVMGDNQGSRKVFEFLVSLVDEMSPDFAISVGDVTNNGQPDEYGMFLGQIGEAGVPWFVVPGNHEYRTPEGTTSIDGQNRFKKIFGKQDFMFDHCGWRFIGLDVVAFDMLRPGQISKLEKALKGHEGKAVVFMHYPPAIIENWEEGFWKTNAEKFMQLLNDYQARFFFAGHIHMYDKYQIGPTAYIVTGGSGGGLDNPSPDELHAKDGGGFYHFIYVKVDGDKATDILIKPSIPPDKKEDWER